jgi:arylsulfatase A-like enzyme
MSQRSRIFLYAYLALGVVMAAAYLALSIRIEIDSRETASVEAIAELPARQDLNVIFILVDTLRAERLGCYGYERDTSQNIDKLAETGIRFAHHVSQSSWTKASMASLWTGLYPIRTGVLRYPHALASEARLPAEIMQEAGFRTAALWRNGWVAPNFGFSQGFETYHRPRPKAVAPDVRRENPWIKIEGSDTDVIRSTREFFRTHSNEKFFLYLHLMDVHQYLYDVESALFGTRYSDAYDNSIHTMDRLVGILIEDLEARGLRDRTLIVLASDHGEAFGEHGREGHAHDVYSATTHVPFLIGLPFRLEEGIVIESRTGNVDIWPTLLDMLGLPGLTDPDGRSLLAEIMTAADTHEGSRVGRPIFAQIDQTCGRTEKEPRDVVAVTRDGFRYIHRATRPDAGELYDLAADPQEESNIAVRMPAKAEELRRQVAEYLESPDPPWGPETPTVELDDMQLNQLRALGYAID